MILTIVVITCCIITPTSHSLPPPKKENLSRIEQLFYHAHRFCESQLIQTVHDRDNWFLPHMSWMVRCWDHQLKCLHSTCLGQLMLWASAGLSWPEPAELPVWSLWLGLFGLPHSMAAGFLKQVSMREDRSIWLSCHLTPSRYGIPKGESNLWF